MAYMQEPPWQYELALTVRHEVQTALKAQQQSILMLKAFILNVHNAAETDQKKKKNNPV